MKKVTFTVRSQKNKTKKGLDVKAYHVFSGQSSVKGFTFYLSICDSELALD